LARQIVFAVLVLLVRLGTRSFVIPDAQRQARVKVTVPSAVTFDEPVKQDFEEVVVQGVASFALWPVAPSLLASVVEAHLAPKVQTFSTFGDALKIKLVR